MSKKFKMFEIEDIYKILEFTSKIDITKNTNFFVDPYILKNDFNDEVVRNTCFNYERLYLGECQENSISDLCILELSQYPSLSKIVTIKFLSSIRKDLIEYCIQKVKNLFDDYNKIMIYIKDDDIDKFNKIIVNMGFI